MAAYGGRERLAGAGEARGQRKGRSAVGEHRGPQSPSEPQQWGQGSIPHPGYVSPVRGESEGVRSSAVVSRCDTPWAQDKSGSYRTGVAALTDPPTVAFQRCGMSLVGSITIPDFSLDGKPVPDGGGNALLVLRTG